MTNFIFSQAESEISTGSIVFPSDDFYAVFTSTTPAASALTRADLTQVGSPSAPLANKTYSSGVFSSDPASFFGVTMTAAVGIVLVKRLGSSPANSDRVISYSDLYNGLNNALTITTSAENVYVYPDDVAGWINVTTAYVYQAGGRGGLSLSASSDGIYYLLGTQNGTVTYDQSNANLRIRQLGGNGSLIADGNHVTKRSSAGDVDFGLYSNRSFVIKTPGRRIKIGKAAMLFNLGGLTFNIRGSNYQGTWDAASIADLSNSTLIYTGTYSTALTDYVINSTTYYESFIFVGDPSGYSLTQLEFFDSKIYSLTANMV